MGGVISSLCCKSSPPRAIAPAESKGQASRPRGNAAISGRVGAHSAAASASGVGVKNRKASQPVYQGEITAKLRQVDTGQPAVDFRDNLRLLCENAGAISLENLEAAMREITRRAPAEVRSEDITRDLIQREPALEGDQLRALARGLCDGRSKELDQILSTAARCAGGWTVSPTAMAFAAGAFSTFDADVRSDSDRLSQQIEHALRVDGDLCYYFHSALLGAMVHERGLDQISVNDYERICHAATHHVYNTGNEDSGSFRHFIPGTGHSRPEIAELHEKYKDIFSSRATKPRERFQPRLAPGSGMTRASPPVPERQVRPGKHAAFSRPPAESKSRGDFKGAGPGDTLAQDVVQWFVANPEIGRQFFADRAEALAQKKSH